MPNRYQDIPERRSTQQSTLGKRYKKNTITPDTPLSSDDVYIITVNGDRLDNLAYEFYNDTSYWWVIAVANPEKVRRDSLFVEGGIQLRIPSDPQSIQTSFDVLNTNGR
jgi:hypothetical protein